MVSVLGVETATFAYALAAAVGLTGLIAASELGFTIVRFAGAAYLVYLGVRKLLERDQEQGAVADARSRLYLKGVLVQALNPKIAVFFLAFLPQFAESAFGLLVLGTIFTLLAVLSDGAYVLLAGGVAGRLRANRRVLAKLSGGIYIGLGVTAALSGGHGRAAQS
jgi:threonine/homoserine/homoserine lactone efflux protein